MRVLYNLLTYLLLIPFLFYWLVRGLGNRAYFDRIGQRFGFGFPEIERCIWVHAVSVGEVQAAAPLVRALVKRFPEHPLLITTVTPTGAPGPPRYSRYPAPMITATAAATGPPKSPARLRITERPS